MVGVLENAIGSGLIEEKELKDQIEEFNQYVIEEVDFTKFPSREDINRANEILDILIEYLKQI